MKNTPFRSLQKKERRVICVVVEEERSTSGHSVVGK